MDRCRLRLYSASDEIPESRGRTEGDRVTLPFGEIFPLLLDAVRSRRTWLNDFSEDEITISTDLYDVLRAYQHFRPSA